MVLSILFAFATGNTVNTAKPSQESYR